ncbi:MAG: hypothetical protein KME27_12450 [Lyngbya sp. HA4199-MV5]|jgi:hypothetical protein|nr:hypothetical protein [Lyngbya sp. HA4199-MV5]
MPVWFVTIETRSEEAGGRRQKVNVVGSTGEAGVNDVRRRQKAGALNEAVFERRLFRLTDIPGTMEREQAVSCGDSDGIFL